MLNPLTTLRKYRRLGRYGEIGAVLVRHGFADFVRRLGVAGWKPFRHSGQPEGGTSAPERLRAALTELGPTFVKLGQILSTRSDLFPEDYIASLEKLQDEVEPVAFAAVAEVISEELGEDPDEVFAFFEREPMASASIAQVHRARLADGTAVAVKVQRPGIRAQIEADLEIMKGLAELIEEHVEELRWLNPRQLVRRFARSLRRELDFVTEAQVCRLFRRNFESSPHRFIPGVFWDLTTERVLTLDLMEGIKISETEQLDEAGHDRGRLAHHAAQAMLEEIFEHQLFHADPHPGNLIVMDEEVIGAVDFGLVGRLDDETALSLAELLRAIVDRDAGGAVDAFEKLGVVGDTVDRSLLETDLTDFITRYHGLPLESLAAENAIRDLLEIVRRHEIALPEDLALLARTLLVAAGTGRRLEPGFDLVAEARPFVEQFMLRKFDPAVQIGSLASVARDYAQTLRSLPGDLERILDTVKSGRARVALRHEGLDHFILEMDRASNRLTFGVLVAALIIGSSLVMQIERGPTIQGFPVLGLAGYLIAGVLGLWLAIAILRSGRL